MNAVRAWWPARAAWSLVCGRHKTSVQEKTGALGYAPEKQEPALNPNSLRPALDREEAYMPRHPARVERHARRLEDLLGFMGSQRERAHRRYQRALLRANEHLQEIRDYDLIIADLRESRAQREPSGLRVAS